MRDSERFDRSIVDVAQDLHGADLGSGDPMPAGRRTRMLAWLRERITTGWREPTTEYDNAVRTLALCAIRDCERFDRDVARAKATHAKGT